MSDIETAASSNMIELKEYKRDDFASSQTPRWCPGCGDYSILAQVQRIMPDVCKELQMPKENLVFVSGIGCSSRFPYYMDTYGFHSIHGRAPTLATGLQVARPELMTWVVTGDGDSLSIGGNHLMHSLRRNVNIKILMFNNEIYGLTKGQYSPTSKLGKQTKSSPQGSTARPLAPASVALASQATFVARAVATDAKLLKEVLMQAARHKGSAFVEIYQNCNIFNDGAFAHFTDKAVRAERTVKLEHGQPLIFGKAKDKAIAVTGKGADSRMQVVNVADVDPGDIVVHNAHAENSAYAHSIAELHYPDFPVPMGVLRNIDIPTYEELVHEQVANAKAKFGEGDLEQLLNSGDTWVVEE